MFSTATLPVTYDLCIKGVRQSNIFGKSSPRRPDSSWICSPTGRQGFHLGSHFPCLRGPKNPPWIRPWRTRFPHPSPSYLSLQSPFHSPWPQGFHKRTRLTCLPWLLSWQFREEINSNKHLLIQQKVCFFIKRHNPTDAVIYLFHTCDSVGVALDQSIWQHRVGRSLLQQQPGITYI